MLNEAIGDPVTAGFLAVLIATFIAMLWPLYTRTYRRSTRDRMLVQIAPSLLATLGVLGTFLGIFVGLLGFDVTAIDASVPVLLAGLQTAFLTSLVGMGLSVVYRVATALLPAKPSRLDDSLPSTLRALIEEQRHGREELAFGLDAICKSIVDDRDAGGALSTRIGACAEKFENVVKTGLDNRQIQAKSFHEEQLGEFRSFANYMVENTHAALIEALESVIADFNDKLTTQFGENFKELNAAVGKTVEWQQNYHEHVELLEDRIRLAVRAVESNERSMASIERSASAIPDAVEPLRPTLEAITTSLSRINADLDAYADLHDKARDAFPLVNANLESITTHMSASVASLIDRTDATLRHHGETHKKLEEGYGSMHSQAEDAREIFSEAVNDTMNHVSESLKKSAEATAASMHETLAVTDRRMKEQIEQLDEEAQETLTRILELISSNLGGISERLASSYEGVADRLAALATAVPPPTSSPQSN